MQLGLAILGLAAMIFLPYSVVAVRYWRLLLLQDANPGNSLGENASKLALNMRQREMTDGAESYCQESRFGAFPTLNIIILTQTLVEMQRHYLQTHQLPQCIEGEMWIS
jgi:hypothetical protein